MSWTKRSVVAFVFLAAGLPAAAGEQEVTSNEKTRKEVLLDSIKGETPTKGAITKEAARTRASVRKLRHDSGNNSVLADTFLITTEQGANFSFGDDTSLWAKDGECDDPRFEGSGMARTLLEEDRGHDASDCSELLRSGRIRLRVSERRPE